MIGLLHISFVEEQTPVFVQSATHWLFTQSLPLPQSAFCLQPTTVWGTHTPLWQVWPLPQSVFEEHWLVH